MEIKNDGEMILCMDANAKIGLMGEAESRNGKLIKEVFDECEVEVMNQTEKCNGVITRQNRNKENEKSAIDFVVATYQAGIWIRKINIDECGDYRIKGKKESDHNTIIVDLETNMTATKSKKITKWNINAPEEKWTLFREELSKRREEAEKVMNDKSMDISERYRRWENLIYKAAIKSIGKTTYQTRKIPKCSQEVGELRKQRKQLKKAFEEENNRDQKRDRLVEYVKKQEQIRETAVNEEKEKVKSKFEKMMKESNNGGFWKERKKTKKDETSDWMIMKNKDGKRVYDSEENKEIIASHYEDLYAKRKMLYHPYHDLIREQIESLENEPTEDKEIDKAPTKKEIEQVIRNKKNNKSTTDWNNEILKRGGEAMVEMIYTVIKTFWNEEKPPRQWNEGLITNIWKGKGDREKMDNQRGITVSSGIGTIGEEVLTERLTKTITFSQAQAGGRKGASTADHIFILKGMIAMALKYGLELIVTFFDIKKAYDRACMDDMLYIIHQQGFTGKILRLTTALNKNLTARVKTKAGLTREIERETGGKQGGKLMVPMFSKMMDKLPEEMHENKDLGIQMEKMRVACLAYVDDEATLAIGYEQQEKTLKVVNDFAIKHQLEWGVEKCQVMEIGTHKEKRSKWSLGDKTIEICKKYKYLGETITRDGKEEENLEEKSKKVKATVREIISCGRSDIMKKIETKVLLQLHETITIPSLLSSTETWTLNKEIAKKINMIELWALKKMFGLPPTTPSVAVIHSTGTLYAEIRVRKKQLIFLHRLMKKEQGHWARETLAIIKESRIGWAKQIPEVLESWALETDWENIGKKSKAEWKSEVDEAGETINKTKLREECFLKERGQSRRKTKTKTIVDDIDKHGYSRKPIEIIKELSVLETRALIMGRFGMLECRANFSSGAGGKMCANCGIIDDENHRMNYCSLYKHVNLHDTDEKVDFCQIHSDDKQQAVKVIRNVLSMWDLEYGINAMRK